MGILSKDDTLGGYIDFVQFARVHAQPYPLAFVLHVFCGSERNRCSFDSVAMAQAHQKPPVQDIPHICDVTCCAYAITTDGEKLCVVSCGYPSYGISKYWWSAIR